MGPPNPEYLKKYLRCAKWSGIAVSETCVETGTYRADGTKVFATLFSAVHTIELSEKWYAFSRELLAPYKNVTCHHGDSAEVLAGLAPSISGPATFYLDAHYAGGDTAMGKEEVPLLRELEAISRRRYNDLVIIDDLRLIGRAGESGSPGDPVYPPITFDWRSVTMERIASVINHQNRTHWICEKDRIIIFRNLSWFRSVCLRAALFVYKNTLRVTRRIKRMLRIS
jgi:hypothetical protein